MDSIQKTFLCPCNFILRKPCASFFNTDRIFFSLSIYSFNNIKKLSVHVIIICICRDIKDHIANNLIRTLIMKWMSNKFIQLYIIYYIDMSGHDMTCPLMAHVMVTHTHARIYNHVGFTIVSTLIAFCATLPSSYIHTCVHVYGIIIHSH